MRDVIAAEYYDTLQIGRLLVPKVFRTGQTRANHAGCAQYDARAPRASGRRYLSPDRQLTMRPTYSAPTGARIVALPQYGQES